MLNRGLKRLGVWDDVEGSVWRITSTGQATLQLCDSSPDQMGFVIIHSN